ncbi:MAG: molybdenum cofactor guanylyltransferase [Acidimicrobiales bacterium]
MRTPSSTVGAILLTGGSSRRMGRDKATLVIAGSTLAERTATLLRASVDVAVEVGPGVSGLSWTTEDPQGAGPLAAIAAGRRALMEQRHEGPALVIACDLPLLTSRLLSFLVDYDAVGSVVPVVHGEPQPLCAKWAPHDLDGAAALVSAGVRSLRHLTSQPDVVLLDESAWGGVIGEREFSDVDSPDDLQRFGLES